MSDHDDESPIDRSLIDAALPALEASAADEARVRRAVLAAVAGGGALAGASAAKAAASGAGSLAGAGSATGAASTALGAGLAWKLGLGAVALAAVVGAVALSRPSAPSAPSEPPGSVAVSAAPSDPAQSVPIATPTPAELATPALAPPATPPVAEAPTAARAPTHAPSASAAPPSSVPSSSGSVLDEARLIARANAAIERHDGAAALAILADHARQYPEGQLREERYADRILALCELGETTRARTEAATFLNVFPASAHADVIRASCASAE